MGESGQNRSVPAAASFADVDEAADPELFREYLREFAAQDEVQRYKRQAFAFCELAPAQRVLDVGCGIGDDVRALASRVAPGGIVTGVDHSAAMIDECLRKSAGDGAVRFELAPASAVPFDDGSFDVVRADRVLIHVEDPLAVVREMVRVTRPGGRTVLTEGDFDTLVVASDDLDFARRVAELRCAAFRHGRVGRLLAGLLRQAGSEDVRASAASLLFRERWQAERFWGLSGLAFKAAAAGDLPHERAVAWLADQGRRDAEGRYLCSLTGFGVVGSRRGT